MTGFSNFNNDCPSRCVAAVRGRVRPITQFIGAWLLLTGPATAVEVHGFLEPYRTVNVATAESGVVTELNVRVGDPIAEGEVIAQLDEDIHQLMVETARARMEAQGRLESTKAEVKLRKYRLEKLVELQQKGHGRREEVERAQADAEIAEAAVLDANDELLLRALEHRRLEVELERRTIRSPLTGVISNNLKEVGEFVAPNEPELVTIVQLDPLLAKFSMRRSQSKSLGVGQSVVLSFSPQNEMSTGIVEEISPVIDAESGTVRVRVRLDNSNGQYDSGQRCALKLPSVNIAMEDADEQTEVFHRSTSSEAPATYRTNYNGDR